METAVPLLILGNEGFTNVLSMEIMSPASTDTVTVGLKAGFAVLSSWF